MSVLYATTNTIAGIHTFTTLGDGSMGSLSNLTTRSTHSLVRYQQSNVSITGFLNVSETVTVSKTLFASNIQVLGDFVTLNTITSNTEQMVIENAGTGPALKVTQTGNNSIAEFYDKESGVALFVGNGGNVGIGTNMPLGEFHIAGSLSNIVVDSRGYMGVGTLVPAQPFHLEGNAYINGNLSANNLALFRNKIINGNFDVWQRGTSFNVTLDGSYNADRWYNSYNGSGATRTVSRQAFTLGQTDVPNEPTYYLRFNQSVAGSGGTYNVLAQRIESVRTFANQTITVSFYAKSDTARDISIYMTQVFGTGGSPSASVYIGPRTSSLTTSWIKYQHTLNIPSISGKTLGTNNNDYLELQIYVPLNTTFTIDIAQVQVEKGNLATPFELRPYGMELQLCQRYYQYWNIPIYGSGSTATALIATKWLTTDAIVASLPLQCTMRTAPNIQYTGTLGDIRYISSAGYVGVTSVFFTCSFVGPITIGALNNSVAPSYGWLDNFGIIYASAEL